MPPDAFDIVVIGAGAAGPPSGFSHLPTLMLAERLSEVVAAAR